MSLEPTAARRVLDALGKLALDFETDRVRVSPKLEGPLSFVEGQRNVIKHYRHVLATQRMPPSDRQALLDRIARVEEEIRELEGAPVVPVSAGLVSRSPQRNRTQRSDPQPEVLPA
jgi:hypothetical protein